MCVVNSDAEIWVGAVPILELLYNIIAIWNILE